MPVEAMPVCSAGFFAAVLLSWGALRVEAEVPVSALLFLVAATSSGCRVVRGTPADVLVLAALCGSFKPLAGAAVLLVESGNAFATVSSGCAGGTARLVIERSDIDAGAGSTPVGAGPLRVCVTIQALTTIAAAAVTLALVTTQRRLERARALGAAAPARAGTVRVVVDNELSPGLAASMVMVLLAPPCCDLMRSRFLRARSLFGSRNRMRRNSSS